MLRHSKRALTGPLGRGAAGSWQAGSQERVRQPAECPLASQPGGHSPPASTTLHEQRAGASRLAGRVWLLVQQGLQRCCARCGVVRPCAACRCGQRRARVLLHPSGHHAHVGRLHHYQHRCGAQSGGHCRGSSLGQRGRSDVGRGSSRQYERSAGLSASQPLPSLQSMSMHTRQAGCASAPTGIETGGERHTAQPPHTPK